MTDWVINNGLERLKTARAEVERARNHLSIGWRASDPEKKSRAALAVFRSAMDWLEDSPHFERAHQELDAAGQWVRQTFECWLTFRDGSYFQECSVALAHNRVGLSIEVVEGFTRCSICGQDARDDEACPHISGRTYADVECKLLAENRCNICGERKGCIHVVGQHYDDVQVVRIVEEIKQLSAVAFVSRPVDPDARIQSMDIPMSDIIKAVGPLFRVGIPVSCDRCLTACTGVTEFAEDFLRSRRP